MSIPDTVIELDSNMQYEKLILRFQEDLLILTFYTNSCSICAAFKPQFIAVQKEFLSSLNPRIIFLRINSDHFPELAMKFQIMAVPTTVFLKHKKEIYRNTGMYPKPQLQSIINEILKKYFGITPPKMDQDLMYM